MSCPERVHLKIAVIPEEKTTVSSFENRSFSRMTIEPSSSSSVLSTVLIDCQFAICRASPSPKGRVLLGDKPTTAQANPQSDRAGGPGRRDEPVPRPE